MSNARADRQMQQVLLTLKSNDEHILDALSQEITVHLADQGATILRHGVSAKAQSGYIVVEVARGIPDAFRQWMQQDGRICDYVVHDVPCFDMQERPIVEANGAAWYTPKLDAPRPPTEYSVLSEPFSLDSPSDELWIAFARCPLMNESAGILIYAEDQALCFLLAEEAINATSYLLQQAPLLLTICTPEFREAPQHTARVHAIRRAVRALETQEQSQEEKEEHL